MYTYPLSPPRRRTTVSVLDLENNIAHGVEPQMPPYSGASAILMLISLYDVNSWWPVILTGDMGRPNQAAARSSLTGRSNARDALDDLVMSW